MFFIRIGTIVAYLMVISGALSAIVGFLVATKIFETPPDPTGEVYKNANLIESGLITFGIGLCIGLLVQIAKK